MCRVPVGALPAGTYTPPTWLDALAGGSAGAPNAPMLENASTGAAASVSAAAQQLQLHVPLPAISDAELSMLDSLLNVKTESVSTSAQQQQHAAATKPAAAAFVAPPQAFLANVFPAPSSLPYGAVTHANASAYAAHASQLMDGRAKRVKKSAEEIEAQIERVKKRRRESAQRSRARKSLFVKSLEVENRELKRELFRLRAVVEAALAAGHTLHPSALIPPPSFAAAAGAAAAGAAAYFADEREDDDGDDREEEEEESCRGDMGERGASNAAFSSKSTGGVSGRGSPISTDC